MYVNDFRYRYIENMTLKLQNSRKKRNFMKFTFVQIGPDLLNRQREWMLNTVQIAESQSIGRSSAHAPEAMEAAEV